MEQDHFGAPWQRIRSRIKKIVSWIMGISFGGTALLISLALVSAAIYVRTDHFQSRLKKEIVNLVQQKLETKLLYDEAKVKVFTLSPAIEFKNVDVKHPDSGLSVKIQKVEIGFSWILTIPLLWVKQLYIASTEIEGLSFELKHLSSIKNLITKLRPKRSFVPPLFTTNIGNIIFKDVKLLTDLGPQDLDGSSLSGLFWLKDLDVTLKSDEILIEGECELQNVKLNSYRPLSGSLQLERGSLKGETIQFSHLRYLQGKSWIGASGSIAGLKNPKLNVEGLLEAELEEIFENQKSTGVLKTSFEIKGTHPDLKGLGKSSLSKGKIKGKKVDLLEIEWVLNEEKFLLKNLLLKADEENISAQGSVEMKFPFQTNISLKSEKANLGQWLGIFVPHLEKWKGELSGNLEFKGKLKPVIEGDFQFKLSGVDAAIISHESETQILRIPQLDLSGQGSIEGTLGFLSATLDTKASQWKGTMRWNPKDFSLRWTADFNGEPFGELYFFAIKMLGSMKGKYEGPLDHLVMDVEPKFKEFYFNRQKLSDFKGHLILENRWLNAKKLESKELDFEGGIYFPTEQMNRPASFKNFSFNAKKIDFGSFLYMFTHKQKDPLRLEGIMMGEGSLSGPLLAPSGSGATRLLDFRYNEDPTRGRELTANWKFDNGRIDITQIDGQLSEAGGFLKGAMAFDGQGLESVDLEGERVRLADLLVIFDAHWPIQAETKFVAHYKREQQFLDFEASMSRSQMGGVDYPDSQVSFEWKKSEMKGAARLFGDGINLSLDSKESRRERITLFNVTMAEANVVPLIPLLRQSKIALLVAGEGSMRWRQQTKIDLLKRFSPASLWQDPGQVTGSLQISRGSIKRGENILQKLEPTLFKVSGPWRWSTDRMVLKSKDYSLFIRGFVESAHVFNVSLLGKTDLQFAAGFFSALTRSEGILEIDGSLNPQGFVGRAKLEKGLLTFYRAPLLVKEVSAEVFGQKDRLEVRRLSGQFREGSITGEGVLHYNYSGISSALLRANLNNTLLEPVDDVRFRASGPIQLHVENYQGVIRGNLQVYDGLFRRRINVRTDLLRIFQRKQARFEKFEPTFWDRLKLDLSLSTRDPFVIRNNLADGQLHIKVHAGGVVESPQISGNLDVLRGGFRFNNRDFEIQSGAIRFMDIPSNVPSYNIRAETEVGEYRIFLLMQGDEAEQRVTYSSDPPENEKNILSLISFGTPPNTVEDPTRSGAMTGFSFVTGGIQDQIETRLSSDFGIKRFHLFPAFDDETGQTELQLTLGTEIIRNRLDINYSNYLSAPGGNQLELDLKVHRNVSIVGSWRELKTQDRDDFGADLRFRFEVE